MMPFADIDRRLTAIIGGEAGPEIPAELLSLGEQVLEHWITAKGWEPTMDTREGFRVLALHRQGAQGDPSFNACRETCRELVYHFNLITQPGEDGENEQNLKLMALVANHLFLFVSGKMETQELGEFCCSSKPLHAVQ